jgi:hypothetical protein
MTKPLPASAVWPEKWPFGLAHVAGLSASLELFVVLPDAKAAFRNPGEFPMQTLKPMVLRPSPLKWLGVNAICLVFVVIGTFMIRSGDAMGWFVAGFFGLGLLVGIVCMLPGAAYLTLDAQGFTMCSLYRAHTYRWEDVTGFGVGRVAANKMVMFNVSPSYVRSPKMRSLNVGLVGYEAGIPDSYGLKHEALAELLSQYLQTAQTAQAARRGATNDSDV